MKTVHVRPAQIGWIVSSEGLENAPLAFLSGGRAESAARQLALAMADVHGQAQVVVRDRRGVVVGSMVFGHGGVPNAA